MKKLILPFILLFSFVSKAQNEDYVLLDSLIYYSECSDDEERHLVFEYDDYNNITNVTEFDANTKAVVGEMNYLYSNSLLQKEEGNSYENNSFFFWKNRKEFFYNSFDQLDSILSFENWSEESDTFTVHQKYEYQYDLSGNQIQMNLFTWYKDSIGWEKRQSKDYFYNSDSILDSTYTTFIETSNFFSSENVGTGNPWYYTKTFYDHDYIETDNGVQTNLERKTEIDIDGSFIPKYQWFTNYSENKDSALYYFFQDPSLDGTLDERWVEEIIFTENIQEVKDYARIFHPVYGEGIYKKSVISRTFHEVNPDLSKGECTLQMRYVYQTKQITATNKPKTTKLEIAPNPSKNEISILNSDQFDIKSIEILNLNGQSLYSDKYKKMIDVTNLENGIYILRVTNAEGNVFTSKFSVKNK